MKASRKPGLPLQKQIAQGKSQISHPIPSLTGLRHSDSRDTLLGNEDLARDKKMLLIPLLICRALPSPAEEQRDTEFWSLAHSMLGLKASQHTDIFATLTCVINLVTTPMSADTVY